MLMNLPQVFDGENPSNPAFNAVTIKLDGSLKADLNWENKKKLAKEAIEKGYKIFWEIELGLFSRLPLPFYDETQGKSLKLSLEIFHQEIWEAFKEDSLGLCLYRGSADFTKDFPWTAEERDLLRERLEKVYDIPQFNRETGLQIRDFADIDERLLKQNPNGQHLMNLFCCDFCVDYLDFICQDLPDSLPLFVLLDAGAISNPGFLAQITSRERFDIYRPVVHGGALPISGLAWDDDRASFGYIAKRQIKLKPIELANIAICLPPVAKMSLYPGLEQAITSLNQRCLHYRLIPEPFLTMEWDGLDYLLFQPDGLSDLGERKLQGFCAAGGTVVTLGRKIGMPCELTFDEWTEKLLEIL